MEDFIRRIKLIMATIVGLVLIIFGIYKVEALWAIAGGILMLVGEICAFNIRYKKYIVALAALAQNFGELAKSIAAEL
jgi:hypothetical protein